LDLRPRFGSQLLVQIASKFVSVIGESRLTMEVKVNIMSSINKRFFIFGFLLIFSISTVFAGTFQNNLLNVNAFGNSAEASLTTAKSGYVKGEAVVIYGEGFGGFEDVSLSVETYNDGLKESIAIMRWNVFTNKAGGFSASIPFDSLSSDSGRYTIKAVGSESNAFGETNISELLPNPSADIDQCGNGPFSNPMPCTGANWQNGNVGQSQGHYYEGDSIPYRIKFDNLGIGSTNTVTIEWDTTKAGKHAIDYITSYNRTESVGNNPCSGVVPACGAQTTFPIPLDPHVSGAGVTQIGGQVLTMWGGTITSVSAYTLTGTYAGDSSTAITITFTANTVNPVLAWGGHIADRQDWATQGGSASDITGSPYHTRLLDLNGSGGNQDRSLSNVAVRLNSRIVIIKQATPETAQGFGFTTTGTGLSAFTLTDDGVDNDATPNNITFNIPLSQNSSGAFTVTESSSIGFYSLTGISCVVSAGGTSTTNTAPLSNRTASITLQYGNTVTCTFTNGVTTAANVSATGKTTDAYGQPIARTRVTIQNTTNGESQTVYTNTFGNYRFDNLPAGDFYIITVWNKRYVFEQDTQSFVLNDAVENVDFVAASQ
jgi:hypothetical protein